MDKDQEIESFLKAIDESFVTIDLSTIWPLGSGQIVAYFDVEEALDIYQRLNKLREKLSIKEIAELMPPPDVIRSAMQHNLIVGLKVAKKLGFVDISAEQRMNYVRLIFEILKQKVRSDIFCLDGKNLIWNENEVTELLSGPGWHKPASSEEKRKIADFIVTSNNLCYTLFFDNFKAGGFYIHGPYDASKSFGDGAILVIREYHNICPKELWPGLEMPYKSMRICGIYKKLSLYLDFLNHPISFTHISDKLIAHKIYLDNAEVSINKIEELVALFNKISSKQTNVIKSMSDLEKVKKGAEIEFYLFRRLRDYMGDDWRPKYAEKVIRDFGGKFVKQFNYKEQAPPSLAYWKRAFDPRDDYY